MVSGHGFRRRPIVAADFRLRSVSSNEGFLCCLMTAVLQREGGAPPERSRCTMPASRQRTSRPPLHFAGHMFGRCAEAHPS